MSAECEKCGEHTLDCNCVELHSFLAEEDEKCDSELSNFLDMFKSVRFINKSEFISKLEEK